MQAFCLITALLAAAAVVAPATNTPSLRSTAPTAEKAANLSLGAGGCVNGTFGPWGFNLEGRNLSVSPGNDFFAYANGDWAHKALKEMPASKSVWGVSEELEDKAARQVQELLEQAAARGQKVGRFYTSFMNRSRVEELGVTPLQHYLFQLHRVENASVFAGLMGTSESGFLRAPFALSIDPDPQQPERYAVQLDKDTYALGLPTSYYSDTRPEYKKVKQAYEEYVARSLELVAWPEAVAAARSVLALEGDLAHVSGTDEVRDGDDGYGDDDDDTESPMTVQQLQNEAPGFDWAMFLHKASIREETRLVVQSKAALVGIARVFGESRLPVLKAWAAFHMANKASSFLPSAFGKAKFELEKAKSGIAEEEAVWRSAVNTVQLFMRDDVSQLYAEKHFPSSSKAKVEQLVKLLKHAFEKRISRLEWMSNVTKGKAIYKLQNMASHIGYPEKLENYSDLQIREDDLFGNVQRSMAFKWNKKLIQLQGSVDVGSWDMGAFAVNAYYDETANAIFFPAAFLQPPFYDPEADDAVNYGSVGATIGHEMTHGFDKFGSKYDAHGKMSDWWTEADRAEFETRVQQYGKQFSVFKLGIPQGSHIKAKQTLDENIADLGGLHIALDGYRASRKQSLPQSNETRCQPSASGGGIDLQERRFFLGYAQSWREVMRAKKLLTFLETNEHAPAIARVDVPLQNMNAWYEAFKVSSGSSGFLPEKDRVTIW